MNDQYAKYRRMLRMGVPAKQVEVAMRMDGVDPKGFDYMDDSSTAASAQADSSSTFLGGTEPRGDAYDKYRKMIKCGLPQGAVEQKMLQDGVDPKGVKAEDLATLMRTTVAPPPAILSVQPPKSHFAEVPGKKPPTHGIVTGGHQFKQPTPIPTKKQADASVRSSHVITSLLESHPARVLFESTAAPLLNIRSSPRSSVARSILLGATIAMALGLGFLLRQVMVLRVFKSFGWRLAMFVIMCGSWAVLMLAQDVILNGKQPKLITKALPYALMRNPFDALSGVLLLLAMVPVTNRIEAFIICILPYLAGLHFGVVPLEEQELITEFGNEPYSSYSSKVKRWGIV